MKIPISNQSNMTGQYDGDALDLQSTLAETTIVEGLTATKTANKKIWSGGTMAYSIVIANDTDIAYENPIFTDQLDSNITLVPNTVTIDGAERTYTFASNLLTVNLDTIAANSSVTLAFNVSIV